MTSIKVATINVLEPFIRGFTDEDLLGIHLYKLHDRNARIIFGFPERIKEWRPRYKTAVGGSLLLCILMERTSIWLHLIILTMLNGTGLHKHYEGLELREKLAIERI